MAPRWNKTQAPSLNLAPLGLSTVPLPHSAPAKLAGREGQAHFRLGAFPLAGPSGTLAQNLVRLSLRLFTCLAPSCHLGFRSDVTSAEACLGHPLSCRPSERLDFLLRGASGYLAFLFIQSPQMQAP